jgi:hypothetical protein
VGRPGRGPPGSRAGPGPAAPHVSARRFSILRRADIETTVLLLIIGLLSLQSCHFQYGVTGLGQPARLHHDGTVTAGRQAWDPDHAGFPRGGERAAVVTGQARVQRSGGPSPGRTAWVVVR